MSLCLGPRSARPAGPAPFNHVKCSPSAELAPFVEHYWVTRWDRRGCEARTASSLLDPCVHLHVQDGRAEVMGVIRGAYGTRIEGVGCVVGVKFRPGGFYPFVSRSVVEFTDRVLSASDVFDGVGESWGSVLSAAVVACDGDAEAHAVIARTHLDEFLGARLPSRDRVAEDVAELVAVIAASGEVRRVSDLVRASGRSERTLDRLFARYVGASPAWVIRRYRLRAAAARLTSFPGVDVSTVAGELGYADQAHFIRDFRATIGVTPGVYVQARG
jgi:AraC-like DNA-binding protein